METTTPVVDVVVKRRLITVTGNEPHEISLEEASKLTLAWRKRVGNTEIYAITFGRKIFEQILAQNSCVGIRSYYGRHEDGELTLIHVGVNAKNNDLADGPLGQAGYPCPPYCGAWNDLNSTKEERTETAKRTVKFFTGEENHFITLAEAIQYVQNYQKDSITGNIKGGLFARNIFDKILAQEGCMGVRYYFAIENEQPTFVVVGITSSGNDIVPGILGERSYPCPPYCDNTNVLNKTEVKSLI